MATSNAYDVSLQQMSPRGIAAVRARLPALRVAASFRTYLDQVYSASRGGAIQLDGQNVFVYRDVEGMPDHVDVEFGVGVSQSFATEGAVTYCTTPSGAAITTTHWGDYGALGRAHKAVLDWGRENKLRLAGPRWEVYGHWREGVTPRTDIYYLVSR
jgi:effector-binding domain-containing protein